MNIKKTIASLIAIAVLAGGVFETTIQDKPDDTVMGDEIVAKRTANSKTWNMPDGKLYSKVWVMPVHYGNTVDGYKAINDSVYKRPLLTAIFSEYEYITQAGVYTAYFDKDKDYNYRIEIGNLWIAYEALFDTTDAVEIVTTTNRNGVKEVITLKDASAPLSLSWNITTNAEVVVAINKAIYFDNVMRIPPPTPIENIIVGYNNSVLTYTVSGDIEYPFEIDPSTTVTVTSGGWVWGRHDTDYATARDMSPGNNSEAIGTLRIGQFIVPKPIILRGFSLFAIPSMESVSACSLVADGSSDTSTIDFDIYVHTSTHTPPVDDSDYALFDGRRTGQTHNGTILNDTWNTSSYSTGWNYIVFNASGRSVVLGAQDSNLKLALISAEDYNNSAPTDDEYIIFTLVDLHLSFTYTAGWSGSLMGVTSPAKVMGVEPTKVNGI